METLQDKKAVIIGGESGIGLATAWKMIEAGADIFITGIDQEQIDTALNQMGKRAHGIRTDVSSLDDIHALAARAEQTFGKIDVLHVNAGVAKFMPFAGFTEEAFDQSFVVNVKGVFFAIQAFVPLINPGSSIIITASINAHIGAPYSSVYAATKAAARSLARTLSAELIEQGIRVSAVSPGPVDTPIYHKLGFPEDTVAEFRQQLEGQIALHRFAKPDEIADAVVFLASDRSSYMVGSELVVDGGMTTL